MIKHALALAARGFKVFPIAPGKKTPPLLNGWPERASSNPAELSEMWAAVPNANIGIHCEGLVVIDVDTKKGGDDALTALDMVYGLPATLTTRTPSGGRHLFFALPAGHSGVPNSVAALGPGLDVRSTRGYVVAPGSRVTAGEYTFEDEGALVAPAPEWLVLRLGAIVPKSSTVAVPDAPEAGVARAREWLSIQPPAVQGYGGDKHTYAVVCGLRDQGVSQEQALALLSDWNARCDPPWAPEDLSVKVHNAYKYAQHATGGTRGVVESDLPAVQETALSTSGVQEPIVYDRKSKLLRADEFAGAPRTRQSYLVKNLLNKGSYAEMFGAPGAGKTFVALDLAYHVAAGKPWFGLNVHGGPVLYLAYEGMGGLKKRVQAMQRKYGDNLGQLYLVNAGMNLREQSGRKELGEILAEMPAPPVLVVVDTFARALMGGDENSAQDVGAFNDAVAKLIDATGACALIVHHSGKNKAAGARGSSALQGALDTELEIDHHQIVPTKQRDVELLPPIGFKLQPIVVGIDEDGEEEQSCVVQPAGAVAQAGKPLSGKGQHAFAILTEMTGEANNSVHRVAWIQKMVEEGFAKSSAHEWVRKLRDMRRIAVDGTQVMRRLE